MICKTTTDATCRIQRLAMPYDVPYDISSACGQQQGQCILIVPGQLEVEAAYMFIIAT